MKGVVNYLSYTTKVYQLTQRFENGSVYVNDCEYRRLQAGHNFCWQTIQLMPRVACSRETVASQPRGSGKVGLVTAGDKARVVGTPIVNLCMSALGVCGQ